jgi:hypothetical protein
VSDFNGDGYDDLGIGVSNESLGAVDGAGVVNVIYGSSQGLRATAASDGTGRTDQYIHQDMGLVGAAEQGDNFAHTLTTGDLNGDGYGDLVVGVPGESIGSRTKAGAVNVIYGSSEGLNPSAAGDGTGRVNQMWHQDSPLVEGASEVSDIFGRSLVSDDFNNDGYDDLAVGAPTETLGAIAKAGAVNLIYGSPNGLSANFIPDQLWHQNSPGVEDAADVYQTFPSTGEQFGTSLAAGDFNKDGFADLAIGVPNEEIGGEDTGAVNVIYGSPSGLSATFVPDQFLSANQFIEFPDIVESFGVQVASSNSNYSDLPG